MRPAARTGRGVGGLEGIPITRMGHAAKTPKSQGRLRWHADRDLLPSGLLISVPEVEQPRHRSLKADFGGTQTETGRRVPRGTIVDFGAVRRTYRGLLIHPYGCTVLKRQSLSEIEYHVLRWPLTLT